MRLNFGDVFFSVFAPSVLNLCCINLNEQRGNIKSGGGGKGGNSGILPLKVNSKLKGESGKKNFGGSSSEFSSEKLVPTLMLEGTCGSSES